MAAKRAPTGCFWRGNTLWGRARVKGKLVRWSLETDDPKLAAQRRRESKDRLVAIRRGEQSDSIESIIQRWTDEALIPNLGAKTVERYLCSMEQISPFLVGKTLTDINGRLVADIVKARRMAGVTNATIKRDLVALSSLCNFCIDDGLSEDNPVLPRMRRIQEKHQPIVLPDRADIDLMIELAPGLVKDLIRAAVATGAREDELISAAPRQVNREHRQMTLIGKGRKGVKKHRVIDLAPFGGYDLLSALPPSPSGRFLFWHSQGEKYNGFASQWWKLLNRAERIAEKRGVQFRRFRFHDLRHYHAVMWLKDGRSIYDLRDRMGHSSINVTEGYCRFLTPEEARVAKGLAVAEVSQKVSHRP